MGRDFALGSRNGRTTAVIRHRGIGGGTPLYRRRKAPPAAGLSAAATGEFDSLWRRYHTPLLAYARKRIPRGFRGVLDPEDVVQDAFFAAFRAWERSVAGDGAPRWLMTVTRNQIANAVVAQRAAKRGGGRAAARRTAAGEDESPAFALVGHSAQGRAPVQCAIDHDDAASLDLWVSHLASDQKLAVQLHFIDGQRIDAIAAALGRSAGSIHMLCSRALEAMRAESSVDARERGAEMLLCR